MFTRISYTTLLLVSLLFAGMAQAAEPVSKSRFGSVAIGGKDVVAYRDLKTQSLAKAITGKKSFVVEHKGANWRFADMASAAKFSADPDKYSPAYNGHCANALSLGNGLLKTDGGHWEIHGDKLYLFYAAKGKTRWNDGNWKAYKADADAAWDKIVADK